MWGVGCSLNVEGMYLPTEQWCRVQGPGLGDEQGSGFRVQGVGCSGCRVSGFQGAWCGVQPGCAADVSPRRTAVDGPGLRVQASGFRVQ